MLGDNQVHNKKTALLTIRILNDKKNFTIDEATIKKGFLNVVKNTGLQGRWQQLQDNPKVICDTAHNPHGLKIVLHQLQKETFSTLHIVLGVVNDKDVDEILPLFPKEALYYFCKPNIQRGLDAVIFQKEAEKHGLKGKVYNSVSNAYQAALKKASTNDFIYVGGSTFVVAEIL